MLLVSKNFINFGNSVLRNRDEGCNLYLTYVHVLCSLQALAQQKFVLCIQHLKNESETVNYAACVTLYSFAVEDKDKL